MAIGRKPRIGSTRTLEFVGGNVAFLPLGIASITGNAIRRVLEHAVPAITRDLAENAAKVAAANARQLDLVHTEEFAEGFVVGKIAATVWAPIFPKYVLLLSSDSVRGLVAVMVICAVASLLAIRAALRVDPAEAIGG